MTKKPMTPVRLEELRQIAGGFNGPKSHWMDELIEEIDRLKDKQAEEKKTLKDISDRNKSLEEECDMLRVRLAAVWDALQPWVENGT